MRIKILFISIKSSTVHMAKTKARVELKFSENERIKNCLKFISKK